MMRKSLPIFVRFSKSLNPVSQSIARSYSPWPGAFSRPMTDIRKVMQEMDRRMADLEKDIMGFSPLRSVFVPKMLAIDGVGGRSNKFSVEVNVAGFKPEEIKLSLKDGKLRVEANMDRTEKDGSIVKQSLVQEFSVPQTLDLSTVESLLHSNGVLEISGDLKGEDAKKIPIAGVAEKDTKQVGAGNEKDATKSKI